MVTPVDFNEQATRGAVEVGDVAARDRHLAAEGDAEAARRENLEP